MSVTVYKVGQRYSDWRTGVDGCVLEFGESGFQLLYFLDRPNTMECRAFSASQPFRISFTEEQDAAFFCFKAGFLPWSDCAFSPHICHTPQHLPPLDPEQGYALNLLHINSHTGELLSIRTIGLGHAFSRAFREWYLETLETSKTPEEIAVSIRFVFQNTSTEDLVRRATASWALE